MEDKGSDLHEARFLSLVVGLYKSAWIAMGKEANPLTGKVNKDLAAARGSIDLLETLKVKTRGNLTPGEEKALAGYLGMLHLNYVDESSRPGSDAGEGEASKPPQSGG